MCHSRESNGSIRHFAGKEAGTRLDDLRSEISILHAFSVISRATFTWM